MDADMFAPQVDALKDGYRCIVWDERAHGRTKSSGRFTYWDSAKDALAILDECGVDRAVLVGMSQGGFLSLRAALTAPERVAALFLIDTQAGPEDPNVIPLYQGMVNNWVENGPTESVEQAVAGIILGGIDVDPWIEKWRALPGLYIEEMYDALIEREDIHDRLAEIVCPALVVHGDADMAIPLELAEALCEGLPNCEGVIPVAGGSHAANLSHPDEVNRALTEFLSRHA
jgi:pimeloyl-ACP methyl ester carboxylesterase